MLQTFLHLSDLHYRPHWDEQTELVCEQLFRDLDVKLQGADEPFLIFSGDLVQAGSTAEQYASFMERFDPRLSALGLPPERRILVPGNHDVSRAAVNPVIQMGLLSEMSDESTFNDNYKDLVSSYLSNNFSSYVLCEQKFARYGCCDSSLGGRGWELPTGLGVYCLNSALCSFAGIEDARGKPIDDRGNLLINTRSIHKWLAQTDARTRILVMHHPLDWLAEWARTELELIIAKSFDVVFTGHTHRGSFSASDRCAMSSVFCAAPPLFTRKSELLGYGVVQIDSSSGDVRIDYRQWSPTNHSFVAGSSISGTDNGSLEFVDSERQLLPKESENLTPTDVDAQSQLQREFDEATTCYSTKRNLWVDRNLLSVPETARDTQGGTRIPVIDLAKRIRSCVIRAPRDYGLTCLGRFVALEHYRNSNDDSVVAMIDLQTLPTHKQGINDAVTKRCDELRISDTHLAAIIIDHWQNDSRGRRVLREMQSRFDNLPLVLLESVDDCSNIANAVELDDLKGFETWFLWSLTRAQIRQLVTTYCEELDLDEGVVTGKVTSDIDALNLHRTPMNCLLLLKLAEQAFDDSPVNRTEMIGRVLYLLFYEFDKIPRYATRPDLKDCEYALGYVSEWMIRAGKYSFTKHEFFKKVSEYCDAQLIDLDCEVLFAFLVLKDILIKRQQTFEFRFSYWLYYFAAHRMHHSHEFCEFMLSDGRYSATPEIIEFYTGIDRRRVDAVTRIADDLERMSAEFYARTGIAPSFDPYQGAQWLPSHDSIAEMERQVSESVAESTLPDVVKDAVADNQYDPAKPYRQEIAKFIDESSLVQMVLAMRGAARALRNSDHVSPEQKIHLLNMVVRSWICVCQILALLSPLLAKRGNATFEGMGFFLDRSFDELPVEDKWKEIMRAIAENVVGWYQEDLFSKKMGALLAKYAEDSDGGIGQLLVLLVMTRQRPPHWEKHVERFVLEANKNSFDLLEVYSSLRRELRLGFVRESDRQQLRRLAAMAVARHQTGVKKPNRKLLERAARLVVDQQNSGGESDVSESGDS